MKYLIVGLGNPGEDYKNSRHNVGYTVLDSLAKKFGTAFSDKRYAYVTEVKVRGKILILVKPTTYMNLSGNAVNYYLRKEKMPLENMMIVVDDLALPLGTIRIKTKGGSGGHNGLQHIEDTLASNDYIRMRVGIGSEYNRGHQVDYVLGDWKTEEMKNLSDKIELAVDAILSFPHIGIERTMNLYNNK
ncbi:MAG TPA: aminoacyl-tRNA hydrolase [Bacteroidales bacterium]|nr:aminoacyl-tRNA hydrolase [Bacteroidales bacterium]